VSSQLSHLKSLFDKHVDAVGRGITDFPLEDETKYAGWLAQTYYFVRHTTRFLTIAASNAPIENRDLHYDMIHHLKGELHHDEVARRDIEALGYSPSQFPETVETSMMYQSQYFWLSRARVSSIMGYALLLEGLAAKYGQVMISKVANHNTKSTKFIHLHCEVDVAHYADGLKSLEGYGEVEYGDIIKNLEQTSHMYQQMLHTVNQGLKLNPKSSAA
jgi:pyrroloquinoline quinone (PQQ) biosynthesis protein C